MKPILYPKNATAEQIASNKNGIGKLSDAISCVVTEELNGQYDLQITYPITGAHFADIGINSVIVCLHEDSDDLQPFEVYDIKKGISGKAEIYAHHISYRLNNTVAMPFSISVGADACANTLAGLKSHATETIPFTFWTDVHTLGTYNQPVPAPIRARLGGVEGSVLDQFGGEYEWDKFAVKLHLERGNPITGIVLKYGKNITDIEQEEELSNVITGVVPFWTKQDGDDTLYADLPEKVIYSQYAGNYSYHLTQPLDLSDQWENQPSEATLRSAAQAYVNSAKLGIPKVSITVSFVALWQTEEYKEIAPLERVKMGDTVTVYFESLGIEAFARVVVTKYNVLLERYDEVQIGSARSTLAQVLNDQRADTINSIENTKQYANEAANNATKWLTSAGGYVIAIKHTDGTWKELVFSNMTDPYDDHAQILRINNNGIGFAKYIDAQHKGGMNGYFRNAWTIDGNLVADFIHGGTLTLGGNNNGNGWLKIVNSSNQLIGKWDKDGILASNGSFTGTVNANAGNLTAVKVTSLTMDDGQGHTVTWTGTQLNDKLNQIAGIATQAASAASQAQSAANTANSAASQAQSAASQAQSAANTANSAASQAQTTADHIENYVDPFIDQQHDDNNMVYYSLDDLWSHLGWTPSHWEPR